MAFGPQLVASGPQPAPLPAVPMAEVNSTIANMPVSIAELASTTANTVSVADLASTTANMAASVAKLTNKQLASLPTWQCEW